jgi:hypothetical protein
VVCQNCWLPAEKNQLIDRDSVSESSFVWLPPLLFYSRVPLLFHKNRGTKVTTHRAPCRWKALIQWGAAWCPKGIVSDTAITTPVPCSPWHDASHLGFGGPESCSPPKDITPLHSAKGWILEGKSNHTSYNPMQSVGVHLTSALSMQVNSLSHSLMMFHILY